ncbi:MAG: SH3 domain-containing protein [Myxococcota bacterium]
MPVLPKPVTRTPVLNWVQARFADGTHFVSDAPPDCASELERGFPMSATSGPPGTTARLDVGTRRLEDGQPVYFFRYADGAGVSIQHVVVAADLPDAAAAEAIEAAFAVRYGAPLTARLDGLAGHLRRLRVSEATATLAELFLSAEDTPAAPRASKSVARPPARRPRDPSTVPWLIAVAAVGVAAWLGGSGVTPRVPELAPSAPDETAPRLPAVAAPPPLLELADPGEVERLGLQLVAARRRHAQELEARDARIASLESAVKELEEAEDLPAAAPQKPAPAPQSKRDAGGTPARVTASVLWVREGPSSDHKKVMGLVRGTPVRMDSQRRDGWARILHPAKGWAAARYLGDVSLGDPSVEPPRPAAKRKPRPVPADTPAAAAPAVPAPGAARLTPGFATEPGDLLGFGDPRELVSEPDERADIWP